jgi:hypothetical protein
MRLSQRLTLCDARAFKKIAVKCHPDKDKDNKYANDNFVAIAGGKAPGY